MVGEQTRFHVIQTATRFQPSKELRTYESEKKKSHSRQSATHSCSSGDPPTTDLSATFCHVRVSTPPSAGGRELSLFLFGRGLTAPSAGLAVERGSVGGSFSQRRVDAGPGVRFRKRVQRNAESVTMVTGWKEFLLLLKLQTAGRGRRKFFLL